VIVGFSATLVFLLTVCKLGGPKDDHKGDNRQSSTTRVMTSPHWQAARNQEV
jgi:hypothetical protein